MSAVVADTHAVVWYLFDPGKLSPAADAALNGAVQAGARIYVSAISVIEALYLVEKTKLPRSNLDDLVAAVSDPAVPIELLLIDLPVALKAEQIPCSLVPDRPDRVIAATALAHNLPLVTADKKIQSAPVTTIW
jgi:PIN domain nuclease of toxin-antitoxin system